jgi:hypothetical protein
MKLTIALFAAAASAAILVAQAPPERRIAITHMAVGAAGVEGMIGGPIKGQPYSAEAISETNQVLSDGNRISHRTTSFVARDSQGRTRHEARINLPGGVAMEGDLPQIVMIHDPLAQATYTLDTKAKTARKMPTAQVGVDQARRSATVVRSTVIHSGPAPEPGAAKDVLIHAAPGQETAQFVLRQPTGKTTKESLGVKAIEGVLADGQRITITLPASEVGAERDIQIVNEVWTAQDLKAVVYSKRSDPRSGEMIYRLANIQRAEPPANLFEVPADFKIVEGLPDKVRIWRSKDE